MDSSFYAAGAAAPPAPRLAATPRRTGLDVVPDLPAFRAVPPSHRLSVDDLKLPDGTPMVGPDGLLVPPARSFNMVVNAATRVFSYRFDEAMRDNFVNARAMRRDAFLLGLLEERLLPTINRRWQIEVDDDTDPDQKLVRDAMTGYVKAIPAFDMFKRALLDGVWFGRAGCQWNSFRNPECDGIWTIQKWDPIHGDSVQFSYDGIPAILLDSMTAGWYAAHGATVGPGGDLRPTDRGGPALVLQRPYWRDRFAIHVHMKQKADYFEGELAGSVQGFGLRGQVYWHYVIRTEALTWMLAYMQAVGQMDLLVFNYPQGDDAAKANAEANARKIIGKAAMACPRNPQGTWPAIEQIPMNSEGLKALHDLISDYFDRHIERLIVGQSMSAGADNESGLGGTGRADFAKATKDEILVYDTNRLDGTLTEDVVGPAKRINFPWAKFPVRFKSVLPDLEAEKKVTAAKTVVELGVEIRKDEVREAAGFSRPEKGDETIGGQQPGAGPGMPGASVPGQPFGPPGAPGTPQPGQPASPQPSPSGAPPQSYPRTATPPTPQTPPVAAPPTKPPVQNSGTSPVMGFPGGGNTYLPGFGGPRRPDVAFTRFQLDEAPTQYADGKWVQMGAQGSEGAKHGGTPVFIKDGVIEKGPPSLTKGRGGEGDRADAHHEAARRVVEKGKQSNREHAVLLSPDGRVLGEQDGEEGTVEVPSSPESQREGAGLTLVHNHPDGTPLSPQDFTYLYHYPGVSKVSAVTHDGKVQTAELSGNRRDVSAAVDEYVRDVRTAIADAVMDLGRPLTAEDRARLSAEQTRLLGGVTQHLVRLGLVKFSETSLDGEPSARSSYARDTAPVLYHSKGCLLAPLHGEAAMAVLRAGARIPDDALAEDGREDEPHVTVRYGFTPAVTPAEVAALLADVGPVRLRLGKAGVFESDEHDVVFLEVESADLHRLHQLTSQLPHTSKHPTYRPHATVAYVKPGLGKAFAAMIAPADLDWEVPALDYREPTPTLYADDGKWVQMGAHGPADDRHGGTPVFIRDGVIEKGPGKFVGKSPGSLKEKAKQPERSWKEHKADRAAGREKAAADREAEKAKIEADALAALKERMTAAGLGKLAAKVSLTHGRFDLPGRPTPEQRAKFVEINNEVVREFGEKIEALPKLKGGRGLTSELSEHWTDRHTPEPGTPERAALERDAPTDPEAAADLRLARLEDMHADPTATAGDRMLAAWAARDGKGFSAGWEQAARQAAAAKLSGALGEQPPRSLVDAFMRDPTQDPRALAAAHRLERDRTAAQAAVRAISVGDLFLEPGADAEAAWDRGWAAVSDLRQRAETATTPDEVRQVAEEAEALRAQAERNRQAAEADAEAKEAAEAEARRAAAMPKFQPHADEAKSLRDRMAGLQLPRKELTDVENALDDADESIREGQTGVDSLGDPIDGASLDRQAAEVGRALARVRQALDRAESRAADVRRQAEAAGGMGWATGRVGVQDAKGRRTPVPAEVSGPYAVTADGLVHAPTGLKIAGGGAASAKALAAALDRLGFTPALNDFEKASPAVKRQIVQAVRDFEGGRL